MTIKDRSQSGDARGARVFRRVAQLFVLTMLLGALGVVLWPGGASATPTCTKEWNGNVSASWIANGNWTPSGPPGASDYVCIKTGTNNPTIAGTSNISIAGLDLEGPTLTVTGTLTLTDTTGTKSSAMTSGTLAGTGTVTIGTGHTFNWNGGTMAGGTMANPGSTVVASGGTLAIDLSPNLSYAGLDTRTLTNNGTTTYQPGTGGLALYLGLNCSGNPTSFVNNGAFTYSGLNSSDPGIPSSCGTNTIINNGTFTRTAGSASAQVGPLFNNAGTVTSQVGTLALSGGSGSGVGSFGASVGALVSMTAGTFNLGDGSTFTGGVSIDGATVTIANAATLTMTGTNGFTIGTIDGAGTMTVNGTMNWTGGTMQGSGSTVIGASGTLAIDLSAQTGYAGLDTRTLTNNGTTTLKPSSSGYSLWFGINCSGNPTSFVNNGAFTYNGLNSNDPGIISGCGDNLIHNAGTFNRSAGTGTASISTAFDNDGTVTAAVGTLSFTGGGGAGQSATGQFGSSGAGKISLDNGTYHLSSGASFSGEGAIGGATVFVDGGVSVSNMAFTSGAIDGAGTMTVNGTMNWTGGIMQGSGSTVIGASGTLAIDLSAQTGYAGLDTRTLTNNGTTTLKPSSSGYTLWFGISCSGNPTSFVNNGAFTYNGLNSNDPGIISGCGTNTITNNGTFTRASGSGSATVSPDFDNNGTVNGNAGTLVLGGAFPAYNGTTSTLTKGGLGATANLQINAIPADIVHNAGSMTLNGSSANIRNGSGANALSNFNDNKATGSFTVTGGKSLAVKPLSNAGVVTVGVGSTLSMNNGPYAQSGGTTTVNGNLTSTGGSAGVNINAGVLQGSGTVTPTVANSGTVRPGSSPGILSVTGGYTQSSGGTLAIEIGGTTAGTGFDQLNATGAATLGGTLSLSTINAFAPASGQNFTIMSYGSHVGCFSTITGRDLGSVGAGLYYDVACNATNAVVTVRRAELSISDRTVTEGNSGTVNANFTVSLNQARPDQGISVTFATADGTATAPADYTSTSGNLTWAAGDGTTRTVTVPVKGDTIDEVNETFFVNLSSAANAFILDSQGKGTITDDDPPPSLSINDVSQNEGNGGTSTFTFTVGLSAASGKTVTVNFATADGTATVAGNDYVAASGSLTFDPGDLTKSVDVTVTGDTANEGDETFFVNLNGASNATIADAQGQGTILNDDVLPVITGFSPAAAPVGKTIKILGSGFTGTTEVDFAKFSGGTVAQPVFTVVSDGEIDLKVPNNSITGPVSVTTAGGTGTSTTNFKVKPKITNFSPTSGSVGDTVTLTGKTFTGTTKVQFTSATGTVNAIFTVDSYGQITCTVPSGAVTGRIFVTNPGGKGKTKTNFTVV